MGHRDASQAFWSKTRHEVVRIYGGDRPKYKLKSKTHLYFRNELQLSAEIKHKKEYGDRPVMSKKYDMERQNYLRAKAKAAKAKAKAKPKIVPGVLDLMGSLSDDSSDVETTA